MQTMPPRFSEAPRESDAEMARWDEYDWLMSYTARLAFVHELIERHYPGLTMPDIVAEACDALDKAGDLLRKRANALEDPSDA